MKLSIGLYTTQAVPPSQGGFERLATGFAEALQSWGNCTRIDTSFDERTWEGVEQGYKDLYQADTSAFDVVISTKAPSYMVQHPLHICYMVHRMRVFYDHYVEQGSEHAARQQLIHKMDRAALDPSRIKKLYTIGDTVSRRLIKWGGLASTVLHPPTNLEGLHSGKYEHFLFVSRLHRWKRGDLVIKAYRKLSTDVPLLIVGTGEDEQEWRSLAEGDSRISFLGWVSEEDLVALYANALAVIFPPINEDFGYVTIEAMLSRTPVITCTDSGEPLAFVNHRQSGLIADPTPQSMAQQLQYCADNQHLAPEWGEAGYQRVKGINWDNVISSLLGKESVEKTYFSPPQASWLDDMEEDGYSADNPLNMVVTDNQILIPAIGGGRVRISYLYRFFPSAFQINYVGTYDYLAPDHVARSNQLSDNFTENIVPITALHWWHQQRAQARYPGKVLGDVLFADLAKYSPRFERVLDEFSKDSDVLIAAHPWPLPFLKPATHQLLVYDSQNCESAIKGDLFNGVRDGKSIVRRVRELERDLCRQADLILVCSAADGKKYEADFGIDSSRIVEVPNGVDALAAVPASDRERAEARRQLEIDTEYVAVFVGSAYEPNTEAVEFIATQLLNCFPNVTFLILGNVRDSFLEQRELKRVDYLSATSRTGLGEGWFAPENWGQPVRWTKQDATISVVCNGESTQLAFDAMGKVKKKLRILRNAEVVQEVTLNAEDWCQCVIDLEPDAPNVIQLQVDKTHLASKEDPRQLGSAITNLRLIGNGQEDKSMPLDGRAGSDVVGDRLCLMGVVDEKDKKLAYQAADFALNPIFKGSGSNIKMFDYLASALPVVTTPVGARGIAGENENHFLVAEKETFADAVKRLLQDASLRKSLGRAGRKLALEKYDWRVISRGAARAIYQALKKKRES
jgi:glycosyltransferase involved in cell wall biosynthesis